MNLFLAEILTQNGNFWGASQLSGGSVAAGLLFLLLLCAGVALDIALVFYCIKRPMRPVSWELALQNKALPGRLVLTLFLIFAALYLFVSLGYGLFFTSVEIEPKALFFQTLFFHVPALILMGVVLRMNRIPAGKHLGLRQGKTFKMLGLSAGLYLAAIPVIWFYSLLYQVLLDQLGHTLYLQEVSRLFQMPLPWPTRTAVFFVAIVAAPVFEEVVFRGILFPWMVRRVGLWPGIALVSLFFAAMHLHLPSLLPLFLLSAIFCAAYARTQSLWVPIGMHTLFNAVSVTLLTLIG